MPRTPVNAEVLLDTALDAVSELLHRAELGLPGNALGYTRLAKEALEGALEQLGVTIVDAEPVRHFVTELELDVILNGREEADMAEAARARPACEGWPYCTLDHSTEEVPY